MCAAEELKTLIATLRPCANGRASAWQLSVASPSIACSAVTIFYYSNRPVVDGRKRPLCDRRIKLLNFPVKADVHVAVSAAAVDCYAFIRVLWQSPRGVLVPLTGISALVPNVLCAKYLGSECR
jgi:hypothetical protein